MLAPLARLLHVEAASGIVLFACTLLALAAANTDIAEAYAAFWNQHLTIAVGDFALDYPLWYWVNDALMTLFFFVIGLEIKREMVDGELADPRKLVVPIAAAVGGAAMPVAVFMGLVGDDPSARRAWAVPMATDIAFVVGCLSLLGARVPRGLKIFVLSLAIVDDIFAVFVIALFYSGDLNMAALGAAVVGFGVIVALNRVGVRTVPAYVVVGSVIWLFTLASGIHPTVAGVALGLLTPASAWLGDRTLLDVITRTAREVEGTPRTSHDTRARRRHALLTMSFASREATAPLERLEAALHPWVGFVIMPVFALANANVEVGGDTLGGSLSTAVALGLVLGKPVGITLATLVVVKIGWGSLPEGTSWGAIVAAGCLAGIGFTMSLFVASLGLQGDALEAAKGGVLTGSAVSLVLGMSLLHVFLPKAPVVAAEAARSGA